MKVEDVDVLDQSKIEAFYKSQFANAADFTFFFVGTFEWTRSRRCLRPTSLAAIAGSDVHLRFNPHRIPDRRQERGGQQGQEPKAQTLMSFYADTHSMSSRCIASRGDGHSRATPP